MPQYAHNDVQGSVGAITDNLGVLTCREHFTPYGEKIVDPACNKDDVGYTGHVQDDLSGLTYMQARYYDPVAGRFLSTDPIGYQDQINQYAYVGNDPMNATDPTGEEIKEIKPEDPRNGQAEQARAMADAAGISDKNERSSFIEAAGQADQRAANMASDYGSGGGTSTSGIRTSNPMSAFFGSDREFKSDQAVPAPDVGGGYANPTGTIKGGSVACCLKGIAMSAVRDVSASDTTRSAAIDRLTAQGQRRADKHGVPVSVTVRTTAHYGRDPQTDRFVVTPDEK